VLLHALLAYPCVSTGGAISLQKADTPTKAAAAVFVDIGGRGLLPLKFVFDFFGLNINLPSFVDWLRLVTLDFSFPFVVSLILRIRIGSTGQVDVDDLRHLIH